MAKKDSISSQYRPKLTADDFGPLESVKKETVSTDPDALMQKLEK